MMTFEEERRKKKEGRRKKEEGRRKKEEGRRQIDLCILFPHKNWQKVEGN